MMSCSTTGCMVDSVSTADNSGGVASAADAGGSGGSSSAGPPGGRQCLSGGATASSGAPLRLSMPQWCNTVAFATELRNASGDILYVPDLVFPDPPSAGGGLREDYIPEGMAAASAPPKPTVRSGQILVRDLKQNFAAYLDQQKRPRATTISSRTHPDLVYFFLDETTETSDEDDVEDVVEPRILEDTDVIDMAFQTTLLPYTLPGPPNGFAQQQIQIYCLRRLATNLATMMNNPNPNQSDADVLRVVVRPAKVELVRSTQVLGLAALPGQALEGDKDALLFRALQEQREKVVANAKRSSESSPTSHLSSRPQLVVAFLEARVVPPPRTETLYPSILRQNATSREEDESWSSAAWSRPMEWTVRVQYESAVAIGPGCRRLHQELQFKQEEEEDTVYQGVYRPDPLDDENAQLEGQAAHDRSLLEAVRYCRTAVRAERSVTRRSEERRRSSEEGEDGGGVLTQEAISVPESMVERLGNYGSTPNGHAVLPHAHGRNYREAVSYGPIVGGDVLLFSVGTTNLSELFDIRDRHQGSVSESESEAEEYDEYDDLERCPEDHAQEELQKLFLLKDRAHLSLRKKLAHQEQRASACHTNLVVFDSNQAAADFLKKMYANYFDQVFLGKDRSGGLEIKNILRGMKIFDTLEEAARWLMRAHENWKACGRG